MADAFFEQLDERRFRATELTRGPWDPRAQHAGPPAALLGHAIEACEPRDATQIVRITFEILRPVPIGEVAVSAQVLRGGRNVELLAGELTVDGQTVLRANAWRMRTAEIETAAHPPVLQPAPPGDLEAATSFPWSGDVGYHTAMEWRPATGGFSEPGPAQVWMRMRHPLIGGKEPTPLNRVLIAADSGNGVSAVLEFAEYVFVNTDLTVALHRLPAGEWVCLDARTTIEAHGVGLAQSQLFDEDGPLGTGLQSLFVARR